MLKAGKDSAIENLYLAELYQHNIVVVVWDSDELL
jgi:hypothetical protein